jgi:hypothetical protein
MPSTYDSLRNKFLTDKSDGIVFAETILRQSGFSFDNGWIIQPDSWDLSKHTRGEIIDARDYLIEEWDYAPIKWQDKPKIKKPTVVCLCGSTRFKSYFEKANADETLAGNIVLSVGIFGHADSIFLTDECKNMLDELHKRKIDLADEILVINVEGYIGESTRSEIAYAREHGKMIRFFESANIEDARS